MTNRVFIDSNIWVYFFSDNENHKAGIVERFLADSASKSVFMTSCQVVNEVSNVLKRHGFPEEKIRVVIQEITNICLIQDLTVDISLLASGCVRSIRSLSGTVSSLPPQKPPVAIC